MRKAKGLVLVGMICVLIISLLAGCAKSGDKSADTSMTDTPTKTEKEKVTISAMVQQSRYYDGLKAMISKLEKEENIVIDVQVVPDAESLNMIKMKLNSGEAPDMIDYNVPAVYDIVDAAGNFADLSNEAWVANLLVPDNVVNKDGKFTVFHF